VLRGSTLDSAAWILVYIKGVHYAEWKLIRLEFACEPVLLLDRDHLVRRVKFIQEKNKKLVKQLTYRGCVPLVLLKVPLVDNTQI
jgi:hypothetical protein